MSKTTMVPCPTCHKPSEYSPNNPWRPFCCERCKLIDLGEWANEEKVIPGRSVAEDANHPDPDQWDYE
ncbi:DNA gyrase inhibitor YacG [Celerinatantimonas sp. YJH-8]|uniref:DNA gyrase inhibitor YacG n=1 Tax=Celerinatantimonas sp. YJH-8 TaxID=3228714 RepID=UPI0038C56C94